MANPYIKLKPGNWLLLTNDGKTRWMDDPPNVIDMSPIYDIRYWSPVLVDLLLHDYRVRWIYFHESLL